MLTSIFSIKYSEGLKIVTKPHESKSLMTMRSRASIRLEGVEVFLTLFSLGKDQSSKVSRAKGESLFFSPAPSARYRNYVIFPVKPTPAVSPYSL